MPMAPPEHNFRRAQVVIAPDDDSGGKARGGASLEGMQLHGTDFGDRERWNKAVAIVSELQKYGEDKSANRVLGLPDDTEWDKVEKYIYNQEMIYVARAYGLPDDTPREVIDELLQKEEDEKLQEKAHTLGLPQNATGNQIFEKEMALRAQKVGLSENAEWRNIWQAEKEQKRMKIFDALGIRTDDKNWDWETVLRRALCVSGCETAEDYVERIQEIRAWHIERLVRGELE